jgi:chromosome segregation ATPase
LARTREDSARRADAAATETETLRRELEKVLDALDGEKKEKALVEERFASERERLSDEAVDEAKRLQAKLDDASVAIERATQARDAIEEQMADAVASNAATKDETLQLKKQLDDAVHALSDAIIEKSSAESKIAETEARNQELEKAKASQTCSKQQNASWKYLRLTKKTCSRSSQR